MDISINGKPADIVPDTEKTLGELLSGLELWLSGSGHRLSGLRIDGETIGSVAMAEAFNRDLATIATVEISTSSWLELAMEALSITGDFLRDWKEVSFKDRPRLREVWEGSASAAFLSTEISDVFSLVESALEGEGLFSLDLAGLIEERVREIADPWGEFSRAEDLVATVTGRLEELPLDTQTGKDGRAAETVQLFSRAAEKIFRLFSLLRLEGFSGENLRVENLPVHEFINEFGAALRELLVAYDMKDAVLVGDLAEYELAPRLRKLYRALRDSVWDSVVPS